MKFRAVLTTFLLSCSFLASGQVVIWYEDFESYEDGVTVADDNNTANPSVDWSHDGAANANKVFATNPISGFNSFFHRQGNSTWTSEVISITGYSDVAISIALKEQTCEAGDKIETFYSLDGGGAVEFGDGNGDGVFNLTTNNITGLSGSTLVITVVTTSGQVDDKHKFDDILVQGMNVLPVGLSSLLTKTNGREVQVSWTTITELYNDFFSLEYSVDGKTWELLADIPGAFYSTQELSYSYTFLPEFTLGYCRLSQTDLDGKIRYFPVVTIVSEVNSMEAFPNPFENSLTISLPPINEEQLKVYSISGQLKHTQKIKEGTALISLSTNDWERGTYLVYFGNHVLKVIK